MSGLPLEGIRVTDVTNSWAGPYAAQLLASMGAEVIKVGSIQRLDPWRMASAAGTDVDRPWEHSPVFNAANTDKFGITLDLTRPQGVEVFKRLVKVSDVVAENYTPRVMKNFGLDYPVLKQVKPDIIMISLPSHGLSGPWTDYPGFALSIETMAGIAQLTGYPDGPPRVTGISITDPLGGANGMAAIMIALIHRQMTGEGQQIDLSQIEAMTCTIGDAIAEYSMNGRIRPRRGNRHPSMSPHGYYCCQGEDLWVGIAVSSDQEWTQFGEAIGQPPWTKEDRFADGLSRWHNQDELDKLVEAWTIEHDHIEVMDILQKAGVAAGAVFTAPEHVADPHIKQRGVFQTVDRSLVGPHTYPIPSAPMRLSGASVGIRRPAPLLGEHNHQILGELLGMSEEAIAQLEEENVIGTGPPPP